MNMVVSELDGRQMVTLYQRCGQDTFLVKAEPIGEVDMKKLLKEMRARLEETIEAHFQPNACEHCGGRDGVMASFMKDGERRIIHPLCYPDWAGQFWYPSETPSLLR